MSIDEIEARLAAHKTALSTLNEALAEVIGKRHHANMASLIKAFETCDGERTDRVNWLIEELREVFAESLEATKVVGQ